MRRMNDATELAGATGDEEKTNHLILFGQSRLQSVLDRSGDHLGTVRTVIAGFIRAFRERRGTNSDKVSDYNYLATARGFVGSR